MKSTWSVIVAYGNAKARARAVLFCETLIKRFWTRLNFEVAWVSFEELKDDTTSRTNAHRAAGADLVVFATEAGESLPWYVAGWVESWVAQRQEREGTFAALQAQETVLGESAGLLYLRQIAHRAGMDFLTDVPEHIPDPFAETPEVYTARARQVTTVLDDILRQSSPRSFF